MWREIIKNIKPDCEFHDPATIEQIDEIEKLFHVQLPPDMKNLLLETNGVSPHELGVIWSTEAIKLANLEMRENRVRRENYMPFDHLLFFGDNAAGDYYGYPITASGILDPHANIFFWAGITDERNPIAYSLEDYLIHYGLHFSDWFSPSEQDT